MQGKQKKTSLHFLTVVSRCFSPKSKKSKEKKSYKMQLVRARGFISVSSCVVLNCKKKKERKIRLTQLPTEEKRIKKNSKVKSFQITDIPFLNT